jgi:fructose-1,6-bisphosphatase I
MLLLSSFFFLAGGQAVNNQMQRMLDIVPEHIHDRSGIFMGSYDEVEKVKAIHAKHQKN